MEVISRALQPVQILFESLTALVSYDPGQWLLWMEKAILLQLSSTLKCSFAILATMVINMMMWCLYIPVNSTTEPYVIVFAI